MTERADKPAARNMSPTTTLLRRPASLPPPVHAERTYEQRLVDMWQAELGFGPIGIDDDFFELDGDSFTALNILTAFERSTGIELSPSLLIDNPTIRALAVLAREGNAIDDSDGVITLRDSGSTAPVFFIPGLGGEALNARPLAKALGDEIPFYGIPNLGIANAKEDMSVEDIAEKIAAVIRKANPDGPYIMAGYCVGAVFAYEVAQQLRAAGADVPLLVMVDAVNKPEFGKGARWTARLRSIRRLYASGARDRLRQLIRQKGLSILFKTPGLGPVLRRRHKEKVYVRRIHDPNSQALSRAYNSYKARPYGGQVILYASEENTSQLASDDLGWTKVVGAGLDVVELPTRHHQLMGPKSIRHFVDDLRERIVAARPAA